MTPNRTYQVKLTVPFHDLDPLNVVWHGNYLKYFDIARFGLFKAAGVDLYAYAKEHNIFFPITKTTTKFIEPLRYGDAFICQATLIDASIKIVMDFEIRRIADNAVCTKGRGEQVALKTPEMEMLFEIPRTIREALGF